MRYRALDSTGDATFGQGSANFLINSSQAVEQAVLTGLRLWQGQWFYDTNAGMPWLQQVIGANTQSQYDAAIQAQIKSTTGVTGIDNYKSSLNNVTRHLVVNVNGQSLYGPFSISTSIPVVSGGFGVTPFGVGDSFGL